ncbi:MAG TPA: hypothetical protein VFU27_09305, partial [Terriglobales bacterium]|nr:hypothetical protein [Terriglobales bacterium]
MKIRSCFLNYLRGYTTMLHGGSADQTVFAQDIDQPGNAARVRVELIQGRVGEQAGACTAGYFQAAPDVAFQFFPGQRMQLAAQRDS